MTQAEQELKAALQASMEINGDLPKKQRSRLPMKFDPTVNLGHIISAATMLSAGFAAYGTLDKRVSVLEVQTAYAVQVASERAAETKDSLREIKGDIKGLVATVNRSPR